MPTLQTLLHVAGIGIGATAVMDLWLAALQRVGAATLNFDMVGRWVGHLVRGRPWHRTIRESSPIPGERAWGWLTHYAVGTAFAGLAAAVLGRDWLVNPSFWSAVGIGIATVAAPLLIMQPAMGYGFASRRTPTPLKSSLRSLANHIVFGIGLYGAAQLLAVAL